MNITILMQPPSATAASAFTNLNDTWVESLAMDGAIISWATRSRKAQAGVRPKDLATLQHVETGLRLLLLRVLLHRQTGQ